jgi:hypothetical protein
MLTPYSKFKPKAGKYLQLIDIKIRKIFVENIIHSGFCLEQEIAELPVACHAVAELLAIHFYFTLQYRHRLMNCITYGTARSIEN